MFFHLTQFIKTVFSYPRKHIDVVDDFDYDKYWKEKRGADIGRLSSWQEERAEYILSVISRERLPIELADIGCGDGSILLYLKERIPRLKCIGYDSSSFALKQAEASGIEVALVDIGNKESYVAFKEVDYYLMLEILEHVRNSEELLFHALRKSRRGVFFSFPNSGYLSYRLRLLFGRFPAQWRVFPNEHLRFWTYRDLVWWLRALGISGYEIHTYKGIPILSKISPSLFSAAFVVFVSSGGRNEKK